MQCVSERVTMGERVGHKLFKHLLRLLLLLDLGKEGRGGWCCTYRGQAGLWSHLCVREPQRIQIDKAERRTQNARTPERQKHKIERRSEGCLDARERESAKQASSGVKSVRT